MQHILDPRLRGDGRKKQNAYVLSWLELLRERGKINEAAYHRFRARGDLLFVKLNSYINATKRQTLKK